MHIVVLVGELRLHLGNLLVINALVLHEITQESKVVSRLLFSWLLNLLLFRLLHHVIIMYGMRRIVLASLLEVILLLLLLSIAIFTPDKGCHLRPQAVSVVIGLAVSCRVDLLGLFMLLILDFLH